MELNTNYVEILKKFGVGRRNIDDVLFINDKPPLRLGIYDIDEENLCHEVVKTACHIPGCSFSADTLLEFESHYNASHRYSCAQCKKLLPSPHLLDLHIQESHDSFFAVLSTRKPSFCCYIEECKEKFITPKERLDHCVQAHKLPKDFRFDLSAKVKPKNKKSRKKAESNMEIVDTSENFEPMVSNTTMEATYLTKQKVPKTINFGHGKHKGFAKYSGKKFTNEATVSKEAYIDIDKTMSELKDSLPDS